MGILDKARQMVRGNKSTAREGIDTAEEQAKKVTPDQHGDKVDKAADAARKGIDKV